MDATYVDIYFPSDYVFLSMIYDKTRQLHYIFTKIYLISLLCTSVEMVTERMRGKSTWVEVDVNNTNETLLSSRGSRDDL